MESIVVPGPAASPLLQSILLIGEAGLSNLAINTPSLPPGQLMETESNVVMKGARAGDINNPERTSEQPLSSVIVTE